MTRAENETQPTKVDAPSEEEKILETRSAKKNAVLSELLEKYEERFGFPRAKYQTDADWISKKLNYKTRKTTQETGKGERSNSRKRERSKERVKSRTKRPRRSSTSSEKTKEEKNGCVNFEDPRKKFKKFSRDEW